jgi:hypothetical protein
VLSLYWCRDISAAECKTFLALTDVLTATIGFCDPPSVLNLHWYPHRIRRTVKEISFIGQVMAQPGGDAILLRREDYHQEGRSYLWHHTGIQSLLFPNDSLPEMTGGELGVGPLQVFTVKCECRDLNEDELLEEAKVEFGEPGEQEDD